MKKKSINEEEEAKWHRTTTESKEQEHTTFAIQKSKNMQTFQQDFGMLLYAIRMQAFLQFSNAVSNFL